jgi:predicted MPP superfamily phosphohydrolase
MVRTRIAIFALVVTAATLCGLGRWYVNNTRDDALPAPAILRPFANAVTLFVAPQTMALNLVGIPIGPGSPWTILLSGLGISAAAGASALLLITARGRPKVDQPQANIPPAAQPHVPAPTASHDATAIHRRTLLRRAVASVAVTAGWAIPASAATITPYRLAVRRYRIIIPDLPPGLHGFRIVQLSDTHVGPEVSESFVAESVQLALSLRPDLIVHTGDFLSAHPRYIEPATRVLVPLVGACASPPLAVLGNHDWWEGGGPPVARALERIGIRPIDNAAVFLREDRTIVTQDPGPERGVAIVGVGDLISGDTDVARAFARIPRGTPTVLLSHEPDVAEIAELTATDAPRIDVMLCGHTHGGQVRIPLIGTPIIPSAHGQKYAGGLVNGPAFPVIISRGIGMTWLPIRWGVPPEVVELTLVSKP